MKQVRLHLGKINGAEGYVQLDMILNAREKRLEVM